MGMRAVARCRPDHDRAVSDRIPEIFYDLGPDQGIDGPDRTSLGIV